MGDILSQKIAHFEPLEYTQIPGWDNDNHLKTLEALFWSAKRTSQKPYKTKTMGVNADALNKILLKLLDEDFIGFTSNKAAQSFFEENFKPHLIVADGNTDKNLGTFTGFVTAYFEPEVEASKIQTERFKYPILKRPSDLVAITNYERPASMDETFFFARKTVTKNGVKLETFPNRQQIESGCLEDQGLEIYWLESLIDIFFIHIQGSARLQLKDQKGFKTFERISYDGKSGHEFTPIGKILIDRGELDRENISMQSIKNWLLTHPDQATELMHKNESFIFFQKIDHPKPKMGPLAAAGVPLTPNRSLAVDHKLQTFGVPIYISTRDSIGTDKIPFQKLMIAQDTGSAIVGAARGDLFIGTGENAGKIAGAVKHPADFIILLPKADASNSLIEEKA